MPRRPAGTLPRHLPRQGRWRSASRMSAPEVAACYDCHGFHDILPPSDPRSHLSKTNILATCQQCHPGATTSFTRIPSRTPTRWTERIIRCCTLVFLAHDRPAHRHVRFFGLHTLGVAGARGLSLSARLEEHSARRKLQTQVDDEWFTRFVAVRALPALPGRDELPAAGRSPACR